MFSNIIVIVFDILFHQDKFVFSVHHLGEHAIPLW